VTALLLTAVSLDWAKDNGVAFDQGKTEGVLFRKKKGTPTAIIHVGTSDIPFNSEATRWLGVWLDSQLMLKEHHTVRLKEGKKAMERLRRLTGQMGLSPANCRKVMTACIQSVAMFGSELWWKGDRVDGTIPRAEELQKEVNNQARAVTGITNLARQARQRRCQCRHHPCHPAASPHHCCRSHDHPPCLGASTDLPHIARVVISLLPTDRRPV